MAPTPLAHLTSHYFLVLDRNDRINPRWIIAKACASQPVNVPADPDGPGETWLREFDYDDLTWLRDTFGHDAGVRAPRPGKAGFATRIDTHTDTTWPHNDWDDDWPDETRSDDGVDSDDAAPDEGPGPYDEVRDDDHERVQRETSS